MKANRRDFLRMVSAGTCGALAHRVLSPMNGMLAFAQPVAADLGPNPIFVLVNLSGGCSYNITPLYTGVYRDRNPNVSFSEAQSLPLSSEQGLHPSLTGLKQVYDEGRLAVVNMVGYPNPNRSHDESTAIWHRGARNGAGSSGGWGARLTCQLGSAFGGISLGGANVLTSGDCNPPRSFGNLSNFGESNFMGGTESTEWLRITRQNMLLSAEAPTTASKAHVLGNINALDASLALVRQHTSAPLPVTFPNTGFGNRCRDAARLMMASPALGTQFIYLEIGGFDTHSEERPRLTSLLSQLNAGLTALMDCAKALGRWEDLTIITMTEFSRTWENSSQGTDHGHAVPMLVMGGRVAGGIKTPPPTAAEISERNFLAGHHVDFRSIFVETVRAMRLNPDAVFTEGYRFTPLGLYV